MLFGRVHANNDILWVGWWIEGLHWAYSALCQKNIINQFFCINPLIPLGVILAFQANSYLEYLIYMVVLALKRIYYSIKLNTSIDWSKDSFFEDNLCMLMKPPTRHEGDIKLQSVCWQAYYEGSSMLVCMLAKYHNNLSSSACY